MEAIKGLLKQKTKKETKILEWQDKALEACKVLKDSNNFKGSIFKCYKIDERRADIALNDCIELNKKFSRYFLKVFNNINL